MHQEEDRERLQRLAEEHENQSWADFGYCAPSQDLLTPYVAGFTYSIGSIKEQEAKFITRAYPTVMTQLYFEFSGDLSEVIDGRGGFGFGKRINRTNNTIAKRTYVKHGIGSWFDIYQLPSKLKNRPVKNLKVDLHPSTLYQLFRLSPQELVAEDLQLADLMGATTSSLMLEEMEAAVTGKELVRIVERYFLDHLRQVDSGRSLGPQTVPSLPTIGTTLHQQARRYNKSERWLQQRYATIYGMSFKQMQSNLKFCQTLQALGHTIGTGKSMNLTELAYRFGYFDQAHFIKDFKRYTGMTPGQYLRAHVGPESQYLFYW